MYIYIYVYIYMSGDGTKLARWQDGICRLGVGLCYPCHPASKETWLRFVSSTLLVGSMLLVPRCCFHAAGPTRLVPPCWSLLLVSRCCLHFVASMLLIPRWRFYVGGSIFIILTIPINPSSRLLDWNGQCTVPQLSPPTTAPSSHCTSIPQPWSRWSAGDRFRGGVRSQFGSRSVAILAQAILAQGP